ncbi:hypothetical protein ZOSMA_373G00220 [Zostera marina]|uniref:Uncharacterized protein n=1 Tax=Zostera marina TaxID=29655 RepID=A0A0K9P5T9_ZOSMR|nr:hypothetical protein ZOSMA_373G00220 [Zostera marina]
MTAAGKGSGKRKAKEEADLKRSEKCSTSKGDDISDDLDLSSDIKGILSALKHIKDKGQKDGQKKNEATIGTVASEIRAMLDDTKSKFEKERFSLIKAISKSSKEYEISLKNEYANFQAAYEKYCKEKAAHLQVFKDIFSKFEKEKEKTFMRYKQQRKKEKTILAELEKTCADKIASAEESLKKKKSDDKSFSVLRKSLGSFLDCGSDDDFGSDD